MDISIIIMLGLPMLYITGSLRKVVANAGVRGTCFVLFFVGVIVLSLLPVVKITDEMSLCLAGAFFCMAPAIYLVIKNEFHFKFYISFVLTVFLSVVATLFSESIVKSYLLYFCMMLIVLIAVLFFKSKAPIFVPVLMGVFFVTKSITRIFIGTYYLTTWFDSIDVASVTLVASLFLAYFVTRPKGRHVETHHSHNQDFVSP